MRYEITAADRAPAPAALATEARYLGYREADAAQPYASFFRPAMAPVPTHVAEALIAGMTATEYRVPLSEMADSLQRPGLAPLETGWTRVGGQTYIAVRTDMPGVTAAMWDWWFGWHSTESARYKLWYPDAHQFTAIGQDRSADRTLSDRQRYVDNVSYVDEYIGGQLQRLAIRFFDPAKLGFADTPGTTYVCARVGYSDRPLAIGWLVHQVRPTEDGSEMRSRFHLNDPAILDLPGGAQSDAPGTGVLRTLHRAGLSRLSPQLTARALPASIGTDMIYHCAMEMNHLAAFLPDLYAAFCDSP